MLDWSYRASGEPDQIWLYLPPSCRHRCCAIYEPGWLPATPPTPTSGDTWQQSQVQTTSPAIEGVWPQLARGDSVLRPLPSWGVGHVPLQVTCSPLLLWWPTAQFQRQWQTVEESLARWEQSHQQLQREQSQLDDRQKRWCPSLISASFML